MVGHVGRSLKTARRTMQDQKHTKMVKIYIHIYILYFIYLISVYEERSKTKSLVLLIK